MKTSNYVVLIVSAIIAAALLFLWFNLGFSAVDNPFDITLAIVWWVAIVAIVALIIRFENKRKRQIRTIYVGQNELFNSEKGLVPVESPDASTLAGAMQAILGDLKYGFSSEDMPEKEEFACRFVVRTDEFKAADGEDKEPTWKGTVVKVDAEGGNTETAFESLDELKAALA